MNDKGIGGKMFEAGVSVAKAGADEIKTSITTAVGQVTGTPQKTDQELQQLESQDKAHSNERIGQIKQELSKQKMRRFQEVSQWQAPPSQKQEEPKGPEIPNARQQVSSIQSSTPQGPAESVRQAVGKAEHGRNFKG